MSAQRSSLVNRVNEELGVIFSTIKLFYKATIYRGCFVGTSIARIEPVTEGHFSTV